MPADFHKDLVVLVRNLVPRYNDLCAREVLQFIYLKHRHTAQRLGSPRQLHLQPHLQNTNTYWQKSIAVTSPKHIPHGRLHRKVCVWLRENLYRSLDQDGVQSVCSPFCHLCRWLCRLQWREPWCASPVWPPPFLRRSSPLSASQISGLVPGIQWRVWGKGRVGKTGTHSDPLLFTVL